jgi:hypothetical protein
VSEPVRLGPVPRHQGCDGRFHDINVLDMLQYEADAFYVFDRGYQDFARFYAIHQARAFFVTRAKVRMDARRVYSMPVDRSTGVMCDQRVIQAKPYGLKHYPELFRRIRYTDSETGKTLIFITNNTTLPALSMKDLKLPASLYTLLQILSVSVFEKNQLQRALRADRHAQEPTPLAKQLILFDI